MSPKETCASVSLVNSTSRRGFLVTATTAACLGAAPLMADEPASPAESPELVRDRLWMFGVPAGVNNQGWGVPRPSMISPVEAAAYLGTPNLFMITVDGNPPLPYDQYALPMRSCAKFVWSLVGSGGKTSRDEREYVLDMPSRFSNMTGFFMDDFFRKDGSGALSPDELKQLRTRLTAGRRKLDLYVVLYDHQLGLPIERCLDYCDKLTFWTWQSQHLANLERNFEKLEELAPKHGKLLGMYMWDYGNKREMPVDLMREQATLGLKWLREGRLEGLIFLGSAVSDIELPAVEWSRAWIKQVGGLPLKPARR